MAEAPSTSTSARLLEAVNFAAVKHRRQKRKDPEMTPYINHPIGVAHILTKEAGVDDLDVLIAAILHDTVEDTATTFEEIETVFGSTICGIVRECSDDETLPKEERKRLQVVNSKNASHMAKLVKLADKLYNLRDLQRATPNGWSQERVQEYFMWAHQVVLGLKGTNRPMEDALHEMFVSRNVITEAPLDSRV